MTMSGVEEMNEARDAHPRRSLGQVFGILQSRLPEGLVAPMQEEPVECLRRTREVEKILRMQVPEDLVALRPDMSEGQRERAYDLP